VVKNAGVEKAGLENGAPEMKGRKMREKQTRGYVCGCGSTTADGGWFLALRPSSSESSLSDDCPSLDTFF